MSGATRPPLPRSHRGWVPSTQAVLTALGGTTGCLAGCTTAAARRPLLLLPVRVRQQPACAQVLRRALLRAERFPRDVIEVSLALLEGPAATQHSMLELQHDMQCVWPSSKDKHSDAIDRKDNKRSIRRENGTTRCEAECINFPNRTSLRHRPRLLCMPVAHSKPSRAEPSRAEPSRAEPSRAEPSRGEPRVAEGTIAGCSSG